MSRIRTVERKEDTCTMILEYTVLLVIPVLIMIYISADIHNAPNKLITVDAFIRNKTIKNVIINNRRDMIIEFKETNHQLWILAYCERSYCIDTYLEILTKRPLNEMIGMKIENVTFGDIFIRKHVNLTNVHGRLVTINSNAQTKLRQFQLESNVIVDLRSIYFDEERHCNTLDFRRGIVRKWIVLDGDIVIK